MAAPTAATLVERLRGLHLRMVDAVLAGDGLDISEHGMYGYPEQFIPSPELVGYGGGAYRTVPPATVSAKSEV